MPLNVAELESHISTLGHKVDLAENEDWFLCKKQRKGTAQEISALRKSANESL
jgi:hypothetical protein